MHSLFQVSSEASVRGQKESPTEKLRESSTPDLHAADVCSASSEKPQENGKYGFD